MHTESLVIDSLSYTSPNLPNFLNPNYVLNTLISPGCFLINTHLRHIAPLFIPKSSKLQKGVTIWIPSLMKSSSSSKTPLNKTNKRPMRKNEDF